MARYRLSYTYYTRTLKSGKKVYYYRTYDENGNRTPGISTGTSTKKDFLAHMSRLIKQDALIPDRRKIGTFAEYTESWWIWDACPYIARQLARNASAITREYAKSRRSELSSHLIPAFGTTRLDAITPGMIEEWILSMKKAGTRSDATINHALKNLKKILGEACRLGDIPSDPTASISLIHEQRKVRGILTLEEMKKLLSDEAFGTIWDSHLVHYAINLTAAATGMRQSELLGVTKERFHGTHIDVTTVYRPLSKEKSTKTNRPRIVPVPGRVAQYLELLCQQTNKYLFSIDTGTTPLAGNSITRSFYRALERIGIEAEERKTRGIVFHSWRHFFNTYCRSDNLADAKLQAITGHTTTKMTENYTKFDMQHFKEVIELQERLIGEL